MAEIKDEKALFNASKVLDRVSDLINVKSRTHLAKEIGVAQSTLHRQETHNELPWRTVIELAKERGWSLDEILGLANNSSKTSSSPTNDEKPHTEFVLKCSKTVVQIIERYLAHPDVQQRGLGEKRLIELRIDLVEILMRIALETQCNQVLIDSTCRSILTIKQAY